MVHFQEFSEEQREADVQAFLGSLREDWAPTVQFGVLARVEADCVGYILLRAQPIAPMYEGPLDLEPLAGLARPLVEQRSEALVLDVRVLPEYRRRGIGSELQRRAISKSRDRQLHQMRSWSSLDSPENYRVKLRLGFAAVPGTQYIDSISKWVPGVYFVMPLTGESRGS